MRKYIVVYSYTGGFDDTYDITVEAKNYGEVEKNIQEVFLEGVEMTPYEAQKIIKNEWFYITPNDNEPYTIKGE